MDKVRHPILQIHELGVAHNSLDLWGNVLAELAEPEMLRWLILG